MTSHDEETGRSISTKTLTRREVLKGALLVGAGAALGPALAACGSSSSSTSPSPSAAATAKKGGHLRVGISGGSAKERLDGQVVTSEPEIAIRWQLYDDLVGYDENFKIEPRLAEEYSASPDAKTWTVRLRQDAVWHNGKPVTADDVIFSYQRILRSQRAQERRRSLNMLKPSGMRKLDDRTVEFQLETANAVFDEAMANHNNVIVPVGFDPAEADRQRAVQA